jgi:hypothetical protein
VRAPPNGSGALVAFVNKVLDGDAHTRKWANMKTVRSFAAASVAASFLLSACSNEPQVVDTNPDPMKEELAKAAPVELPPAIKEAKSYRCKDNSLVHVTYLTDNVTAMVRDKQEEPPVATLKAPAAGQPFVSDGFSLTVNGNSITYNSPDAGTLSCKA